MKTLTISLITAMLLAQPARAGDELVNLLTGIIVGAAIAKSADNHSHGHAPAPRHSPYYQSPNPNVTCYKKVTEQGSWITTTRFNCYDQVIGVTQHRRQQYHW